MATRFLGQIHHKPSFAEKVNVGIGRGLQMGQELMKEHKQEQRLQKQEEAIKRFAPELAGLPPDLQKVALAEQLRSAGKKQLLEQEQGILGKIFGEEFSGEDKGQDLQQRNMDRGKQFDPLQISDADIAKLTAIKPQLGNAMRAMKDTATKEARAEKEFGQRQELAEKKFIQHQEEQSPEHIREVQTTKAQAEADVKFNQAIEEAAKQHELKEQTLDRLDALNKKGVTGKPYEKLLEKFGLVGLTSEGRREFAADVKNLITDIRSILGAQFSGFEFQTILNAYPSADFSKEANSAIIRNLKEFQDIKKKEVEFARQIKKQNKGKLPSDFQSLVNEKVREYAQSKIPDIKANTQKIMNEEYGIPEGNVLMFDPSGEPLSVPLDQVDYYKSLQATIP